ncbi:hypothetical protein HPP92_015521 [Vanilla planifolia]|uniref:Uncharacterized protein n=1 Tax=Vanilla planifolia TaxID=51239 RepID=A0A835US48_VANPL|nr:hypothetical protein HPP92_015521 [Vanilla planifolia]
MDALERHEDYGSRSLNGDTPMAAHGSTAPAIVHTDPNLLNGERAAYLKKLKLVVLVHRA